MKTVMWTTCGYPTTAVCVPLMVLDDNFIPSYLSPDADGHCVICDNAMKIKEAKMKALKACRKTEKFINFRFYNLYLKWIAGEMSFETFKVHYKEFLNKVYDRYTRDFDDYLR